jgi:hypothetical protein
LLVSEDDRAILSTDDVHRSVQEVRPSGSVKAVLEPDCRRNAALEPGKLKTYKPQSLERVRAAGTAQELACEET